MTHAVYEIPTEPDRFRFIIEEAVSGEIVARDLNVMEPKLLRQLSGPCTIQFKVHPQDPSVQKDDGSGPILFKPWGHWCHVEKEINGERRIMFSGIFKPSETDPKTGILDAQFEGFSNYPKDIPWLENWNPIAVDPFEIVKEIWDHLQHGHAAGGADFINGDLGVEVFPQFSGTQMLPGFSFDGEDFILDFFAIFIRAIDFQDCGDYINKLARDIPFDYFERSEWNEERTGINKKLELAYPRGGAYQENLAFRMGENVSEAKPKLESDIEWTSDVIIRGWFPGKVYSSSLSNTDPLRYRRTVLEEDVHVNSDERTAAWSHRQLTRRQVPAYWEQITINMWHPNAPYGSYDVGDSIRVQGRMPWVGNLDQWHKIIAISVDPATNTCQLSLRAEGAFTYDPIFYQGPDANLISNPSFVSNLAGWTVDSGLWTRDATEGSDFPGSARITPNGENVILLSSAVPVEEGDQIIYSAQTKWVTLSGSGSPIGILAVEYDATGAPINAVPVASQAYSSSGGWSELSASRDVPDGIATVRLGLKVGSTATAGTVFFDQGFVAKES